MTSPDHWRRCGDFSSSSDPFLFFFFFFAVSVSEFESAVNAGKSHKMVIAAGICGGAISSLGLLLRKFAEDQGSATHCDFFFPFS